MSAINHANTIMFPAPTLADLIAERYGVAYTIGFETVCVWDTRGESSGHRLYSGFTAAEAVLDHAYHHLNRQVSLEDADAVYENATSGDAL